jgi:shikimate 5-dehydrogenase
LYLKNKQKINFIREGEGSGPDQPTIHEWLRTLDVPQYFAAILGSPAQHSYSPIEHLNYFKARQMPFFAIQIQEQSWDQDFPILLELGLKYAAVTSPLKIKAFQRADVMDEKSNQLGTLNTLAIKNKIIGTNTDFLGFKGMIDDMDLPKPILVWGGGGTLPVLQATLDKAEYYSVRTKEPRPGCKEILPKTLVWAAAPTEASPPQSLRPEIVIDLNYRDDSLARNYAQSIQAKYISGLLMFKIQAEAQRNFWDKN